MYTAQSIVKETVELISLPDVYVRLRSIIFLPDSRMTDIAEVIVHDPAITARLLKLVNSPFFGLVAKVDTMTHAINLLGTQQVHDLVLATVVVDSFSGFSNDSLNIYDFWFNGVYCAVTARLLAYHCKNVDTERPFIAGLLHKIGHLITHKVMPDESKQVAALMQEKNILSYLAERQVFGFDYAEIGAELMGDWQLPDSLQEITKCHVEPEKADAFKMETALIHIASIITHNALADIPINAQTLEIINPQVWQTTGLSIDDMEDIKLEVDQQASSVMNLLFTHKKSA